MNLPRAIVSALAIASLPAAAHAGELDSPLELGSPLIAVGGAPLREETATPRFGAQDSTWLTVGAGVATVMDNETDANIFGAYSWFIVENVELAGELNGWYHTQPGDNALSINPSLIFRWHFVNTGAWTVYADTGIGVLLATDNVPEDGTGVNFTPTFGVGFTRELTEGGTRLQVGLRWHHISNARIAGDERNPARDLPLLYAGIIFPF
jgi:hypothetical protein